MPHITSAVNVSILLRTLWFFEIVFYQRKKILVVHLYYFLIIIIPISDCSEIKKEAFSKVKNDCGLLERFVECSICQRKQHKICSLYSESTNSNFICSHCSFYLNDNEIRKKHNARHLPVSNLSRFMEDKVNNYLHGEAPNACKVHVRLLSDSIKYVNLNLGLQKFLSDNGELNCFPYRSKAVYLFQEIDGQDVAFFAFYAQEFGSDCSPRNARRVNISYIDSVQMFEPPNLRTAVYHEALIAYFNYIKNMGFIAVHLWVEPPSIGDDYIFSTHPPNQKYLSQTKLLSWYKKMLEKGVNSNIIYKFNTFYEEMDSTKDLIASIPLFQGDFWLYAMEDKFKSIDTEISKTNLVAEMKKIVRRTKNEFLTIHLRQSVMGLIVSLSHLTSQGFALVSTSLATIFVLFAAHS